MAEVSDPLDTLGGFRAPAGAARWVTGGLAVTLSAYALYWVLGIVEPQVYRVSFLLLALVLTFLVAPAAPEERSHVPLRDWALAGAAVVALAWPLVDFAAFPYRAATPGAIDLVLGAVTIALVLEATRRTTGWILPATAVGFILYAYLGPVLELVGLGALAHRGYNLDRLVGSLYMGLEGIFGVPLDVASTYIILFAVYGAVLERSGAGRFFIDWATVALGRSTSGAGPGRAVTGAGFLLGSVSGSGVATTVTLGSVAWPLLRRAGYDADTAGGVLAAGGIGAILAPPTLGAAAFLIAEFLQVPYLSVLAMAVVPAVLYYLSAILMIEADARRLGTRPVDVAAPSLLRLTLRSGYHFASILAIVALMALGTTAFRAVFWATLLAVALSFLRPETALRPARLLGALEAGGRGILAVAATTATAGVIVGVVTLTGLGLKLAGLIVALAGGSAFLTVVYAAVAVWTLGLAVPVTASYIIAAVMIAPALVQVGIPDVAAHMFVFYYAVLSEVSPPTALAPFAAAAITGGNPFRTMMVTWKYTLPAFLVPFAFTLTEGGLGILLRGSPVTVLHATATAALGIAALALGFGGWLRGALHPLARAAAMAAGLLLVYATTAAELLGLALLAGTVAAHLLWTGRGRRAAGDARAAAGASPATAATGPVGPPRP